MPNPDDLLLDIAHEMGVRIIYTSKLHDGLNACWHKPSRSIFISKHLDPVTLRCALAHELGHATLGHECSTPGAERKADQWAAATLLNDTDVLDASLRAGGHPAAIAAELGVTPQVLATWMRGWNAKRPARLTCT